VGSLKDFLRVVAEKSQWGNLATTRRNHWCYSETLKDTFPSILFLFCSTLERRSNMVTFDGLVHTVGHAIAKNSPAILTGLGVGGVITTAVMSAKATPGAIEAIAEAEAAEFEKDPSFEAFTLWGKTKVAWKLYLPTAVMGAATIVCVVGSNSINARRVAALASLYSITETALDEYKAKVVETIGETKERKIHDAVVQDHLNNNPLSTTQIVFLGKGDQLCYDSLSGRYFKSDAETIRRAENHINAQLLNNMFASVNDFWCSIGLPDTTLGEDLGWVSDHMLEIDFTSKLTDTGEPCLVIDYLVKPKYDYYRGIND